MRLLRSVAALLVLVAVAACATPPELPPVQPYSPVALGSVRYKAVLIAGDGSIAAFDNATAEMARRLVAAGTAPAEIRRFSASPQVLASGQARPAALASVLAETAQLRPGPGQGCFVFATSHGSPRRGLVMAPSADFLDPVELDRALAYGCGNAPTVAILSGCYSGSFAGPPMNRANRIVVTASRPDRPSFGCGAGRQFTFFDRCLFLAMDGTADWPAAYTAIQACVGQLEGEGRFAPSEPQAYIGPAVAGLPTLRRP